MESSTLTPASELATNNPVRIRNESAEYRAARTALLAQEIELRRHIERVAEQRRALPPGGEVVGDYKFMGEGGPADLATLFGDKQTLVIYSYMYGPDMERPCPMCTNVIGPWDANARDLEQRLSFVIVARSPIERLLAWKQERGWRNIRLYSDGNANYSRDYFGVTPEGEDIPAMNVFTRRDGTVRHFWSGEMTPSTADPGQDPRGAPDPGPCGLCWISHQRAAIPTGIPSWTTSRHRLISCRSARTRYAGEHGSKLPYTSVCGSRPAPEQCTHGFP